MPKHIGIVGCSAEGAALCYRTICTEGDQYLGRHRHPEVSMHTHSLGEYMERIYADDWRGVAELMLSSADKLAKVGAAFLISPDNTIHRAFSFVQARTPLPWMHIVEVVADEAEARGFRRLGLLGTRYTMEGPIYPEKLMPRGIHSLAPKPAEIDDIDRIIMDELVYGVFKPESLARFQQIIERMKRDNGCEAVVLGCTEIPLLINENNSALPPLDSTRLLARAALRKACEGISRQEPAR